MYIHNSRFLVTLDLRCNRLRAAIEDFVFMCQPNDEINKDRVLKSLEYDDEEDSDDDFEADYPQQYASKNYKGLSRISKSRIQYFDSLEGLKVRSNEKL